MCSQLSQVWPTGSRFLEAWIILNYEIVVLKLSSAIMIFCYSCSMDQLWRGTQGFKKQKAFKIVMAAVVVFFLCWTLYNITLWKHVILTQATKLVRSQYLILYAFVGVEFRYRRLSIPRSLCSGQSAKTSNPPWYQTNLIKPTKRTRMDTKPKTSAHSVYVCIFFVLDNLKEEVATLLFSVCYTAFISSVT